MKKILINYADRRYYNSQKNNTFSGLEIGGFTESINYNFNDIDNEFKDENKEIFKHNRGAGYWIWKPYIILKTLLTMKDDDILFYCDSGSSFIDSFNKYLFDICLEDEKGLILFNGEHKNYKYTKRDCFFYMDCDNEKFFNSLQLTATFQLMKKTEFVIDFYRSHLNYAKDYRILTDSPNECGLDNYEGFIDHRHDQSILTNLQIKHGVTLFEDISQYGNKIREIKYGQLINHHRNNS
jgi:hypothetical protein